MKLVSIDIGTTSCKAGLFDTAGIAPRLASRPTPTRTSDDGGAYYDPDDLYRAVCETLREILAGIAPDDIATVGIASMAESGILLDRASGVPRSRFIPWFDTQATPHAEFLAQQDTPLERFRRAGIHPSPKVSLAKLLWLRQRDPAACTGSVWLSAADYVAYRLTGEMGTDYSLAGRTLAFRIDQRHWDDDWIRQLGLSPDLFPAARPSGEPLGQVHAGGHQQSGLPVGAAVAIAGHDHICGALGAGAVAPAEVFNSMGTAEVLLGMLEPRPLTRSDFESGLSFGCHVIPDRAYWLGGLSSSGGSIEWLRSVLDRQSLSYQQIDDLLAQAGDRPTGILYFPYLYGRSSSSLNRMRSADRAAFIGLEAHHRPADLIKAVLQGTAYEMERIRRAAEGLTPFPIERLCAAGGGTRNRHWLQIKSDVSNCTLEVSALAEVTLLGAAMIAGIGNGVFADAEQAVAALVAHPGEVFHPDPKRHAWHAQVFAQGYEGLQQPLTEYYNWLNALNTSGTGR